MECVCSLLSSFKSTLAVSLCTRMYSNGCVMLIMSPSQMPNPSDRFEHERSGK